jgi:NTE family protein
VLSAGGPKGPFQAGAEARAHERGWVWNRISAVSVGALNGCFVSMDMRRELKQMWHHISPNQVLINPGALSVARRLSRRKSSLYPIKGVAKFVEMIDPAKMQIEVMVGAVSLINGENRLFTKDHPAFKRAVLASCALPLVFPPVDIDKDHPRMTDGGVRNYSPLSTVLPDGGDTVMVINCMSSEVLRVTDAPTTALGVASRALDIAMHEVYAKDIDLTLRMNRMVEQAAAVGLTLFNTEGRAFRKVNLVLIEPDSWIADIHSYTAQNAKRAYEAGWEKARQVLG